MSELDAVVVGSGPNGLAAAVTLARAGLTVRVYERSDHIGGGATTRELTLPGFQHDVCSAVHPFALASEFFDRFGLADRVPFVTPDVSYGHPLDDGRAALAHRDLDRMMDAVGRDGRAWRRYFGPLTRSVETVRHLASVSVLDGLAHPISGVRVGLRALEQGGPLWNVRWRDELAAALLTGAVAHVMRRMPSLAPAAAGTLLAALGHTVGWPVPVGGSGAITAALADDLRAHGGEIVVGAGIHSLAELPAARATLLDVTPRALADLADERLPRRYARALTRFRYGSGVAKVDFALTEPVPWAAPGLDQTATVHLGGTREEIAAAEREVASGRHAERPFVLVSQPSLFDATRAPAGRHVLWVYTHVPAGSNVDQTEAITRQIERFAPGFRDTVLAAHSATAADLERQNPNYVGGDIGAGLVLLRQLLARPTLSLSPWRTPLPGVYLCSASTPPGPGVHGMGGFNAARCALVDRFGVTST